MKLPTSAKAPLIMAGLGTGLAPFRAFVQYRAMQKARGEEIGSILLYLGSRHKREEYLYGEEWEAYQDAGVITLLGAAFSRDQPQKIYIQDRMRESIKDIVQSYIRDEGSFYLCGPTWPVPDVTDVLKEAIAYEGKLTGKKVNPRNEIEKLKDEGRYVLERREYSIASAQAVTPNAVSLMIVVVDWVDTRGRTRWGHASRYLSRLPVGTTVTVSVKPSVMKLPTSAKAPLIMAGLGTGLAPFRAFV
ncbi:hypothetical protein BN1723_009533, partial [Verticillium longisporum]